MPPVSPAHSGIVGSGAGGGGGGVGGMEELLPLVLQLTNPDQVSDIDLHCSFSISAL